MSGRGDTFISPMTSTSSSYRPSPNQGGDGRRRARSTFFDLHGGSAAISSEINTGPGADEARSPVLRSSAVSHRSWPPAVPSHDKRGELPGEAQRDTDAGLGHVTPAEAAKPSDQMDEKPPNGTSLEVVRGMSGGAQGGMQSGNCTPDRSGAVRSEADPAAVEESADGGWPGDTAREHSDAVPLETTLPLPEGKTDPTMFLLHPEHVRWKGTHT